MYCPVPGRGPTAHGSTLHVSGSHVARLYTACGKKPMAPLRHMTSLYDSVVGPLPGTVCFHLLPRVPFGHPGLFTFVPCRGRDGSASCAEHRLSAVPATANSPPNGQTPGTRSGRIAIPRYPGVSLRSTPGYFLASLRDAALTCMEAQARCKGAAHLATVACACGTPTGYGHWRAATQGGALRADPGLVCSIPSG